MGLGRKIFRNTAVQVGGKFLSTGINLIAFALMTRALGKVGFGEYTTVITFLSFFAIIADFGLTLVTVQMIGTVDKEEEKKVLGNLFGIRLSSSIVFIALAPLVVLLLNYNPAIKLGVLIAAATFIFNALNQIFIGLFQTRLRMDKVALAETLSRFILLAGVVIAIYKNWGLNGMLAATTLAAATSFILHFLFSRRFAKIRPLFQWLYWKKIIALAWPLAITIALNLIYLRADTLILSLVKTQADVGLYGAAYKIIDVLSSLPFVFAGLILPLLVKAWEKRDKERFQQILQKSFDVLVIVALPLVIGTQFVAEELIVWAAGEEFRAAAAILKLLIWAVGAIFLGNMAAHAIIAAKAQKKVIWIYLFTSVSSLIAYLIFIPKFSYMGAAAVTIYSESAIALLSIAYLHKRLGYRLSLKTSFRALGAVAVMAAFLYYWPKVYLHSAISFAFSLLFAAGIYLISLIAFRAISKKELISILSNKKDE